MRDVFRLFLSFSFQIILVWGPLLCRPLAAQTTPSTIATLAPCDLALALAVDVSGSVDAAEYDIQMQGLAAALRDGVVAESLLTSRAMLTLVQWTGTARQQVTLPWVQITSVSDLEDFAARVAADPRQWHRFSTAIGEALDSTADLFAQTPDCRRLVIDVSGDGASNEGKSPQSTHARLRTMGVTVNAVVIETGNDDLTRIIHEAA